MKKSVLLMIVLFLLLSGCAHKKVNITIESGSFSYSEVYSIYAGDPGVKESGFVNIEETNVESVQQVIELAKNECSIEYDRIYVSYDPDSQIYEVSFGKEGCTGGQAIYIDQNGITVLIVSGE